MDSQRSRPAVPHVIRTKNAKSSDESLKAFERLFKSLPQDEYLLRLYLTGSTPKSLEALKNIKRICEERLKGKYKLEVIDIYQRPTLAFDEQIVATPTLIKVLPSPIRRLIGDLSSEEKVLFGLDLRLKTKKIINQSKQKEKWGDTKKS